LANELYGTLLGPVEALIKDKPQLIVVPSGALTRAAVPSAGDGETSSRGARAIGELSRGGLADQAAGGHRAAGGGEPQDPARFWRREKSGKPLVGFGDPVFNPHDSAPAAIQTADARSVSRGYTAFWQGAGIDRAQLSQLRDCRTGG